MKVNEPYVIEISKKDYKEEINIISYLLDYLKEIFSNYIKKEDYGYFISNKGLANLVKEIDIFKNDSNREYKYLKSDKDNLFTTGDSGDFYAYRKGILEEKLEIIKTFMTNELIKVTICENKEVSLKFIL